MWQQGSQGNFRAHQSTDWSSKGHNGLTGAQTGSLGLKGVFERKIELHTPRAHHNRSHKFATFCSMIHCLKNIPLNPERYEKEWIQIKSIASKNGYDHKIIDRISKNMNRKLNIRNVTSLSRVKDVDLPEKIIPVYYNKIVDNAFEVRSQEIKYTDRKQKPF